MATATTSDSGFIDDVDTIEKPAIEVSFHSDELEQLLNIIDDLRSQGISRYIDLPQLIVCGDQSSGKSSVLEAVSGVRFPTKDNLCTRFPTELVLRRGPEKSPTVSIVPDIRRPDNEVAQLRDFTASSDVLKDFASIVDAAAKAMGLDQDSKVFGNDVLRVEITGPKQPHLTLVDLPGLFHAGNKAQSTSDAAAVKALVTGYMEKSRSIILAVVSAKNDYANQIVTKYAHDVDPRGERTLGIITKPDTLDANSESEKQFLELAQNKDVALRLGWHVLKNRDFANKDCSADERDEAERNFFSKGIWTSLFPTKMGIGTLKPRLSRVLRDQILAELPGLMDDVEGGIRECEDRLTRLGGPRATPMEQRTYLHQASQRFTELVKAGLQGRYEDAVFRKKDANGVRVNRIAAVVYNLLDEFAEEMALRGCQYKVVNEEKYSPPDEFDVQSASVVSISNEDNDSISATEEGFSDKSGTTPIYLTREQRLRDIKTMIKENRGRELPGFPRFENVAMLFREQCAPWQYILRKYTNEIFLGVRLALYAMLEDSTDSTTSEGVLRLIVEPALEDIKHELNQKMLENLAQHQNGHPVTFNHYFTENLQKLRAGHEKDRMKQRFMTLFPNAKDTTSSITEWNAYSIDELVETLVVKTEADMTDLTCSEALYFMDAYYKVALKFIIDDFSIHTITRGLLDKLPEIFDTNRTLLLDEKMIEHLAGETDESKVERASSSKKLEILKKALHILRQLDRGRSRKAKNSV